MPQIPDSQPKVETPERWHHAHAFKFKTGLTWLILLSLLLGTFSKMGLDWSLISQKLPFLLGLRLSPDGFIQGAALTIMITACSMFFCLLIGLITALGRMSDNALAFGCATFYASLFRGTPLLVQVLIIYLALPQVGIVLGALSSGIIALSMNYGAYLAETIRSGVLSVPRGQQEAALALGVSRWTVAVHVTAPQALRIIIPPAGSMFISMLKDSSLVSLMGLWELNFLAQSYGRSTYRYMEMLATAAAIYWIMSIVLELLQSRLERRFAQGHRR
ncbi:amino acid ABC transporter permease [Rahnella sp. Larv3_ips]|uniref:amino acid ABC transporter permease n=1 Tax=Rahnella sp. Larv3_ips TaxID=1896943 RepID=UPI000EFC7DB9|nr:amino acid ABC transporter permease [Rahnella sp. Larv3_ips]MBB6115722.1 polar amino acid transport system permease protein [Rahnella inusitata]THD44434.1 amino acid ABC transporter permease [Enterobacteriaceae bacterium ML5]